MEVDRTVNQHGCVGLGGLQILAAEILGGRRVGIRIDHQALLFFDPDTRELLRSRPSPFTLDQARKLQSDQHGAARRRIAPPYARTGLSRTLAAAR